MGPQVLTPNVPSIYIRFVNQEFEGYFSDLALSDAFKKLDNKIKLNGPGEKKAITAGTSFLPDVCPESD